jgi:hypothetical protein
MSNLLAAALLIATMHLHIAQAQLGCKDALIPDLLKQIDDRLSRARDLRMHGDYDGACHQLNEAIRAQESLVERMRENCPRYGSLPFEEAQLSNLFFLRSQFEGCR